MNLPDIRYYFHRNTNQNKENIRSKSTPHKNFLSISDSPLSRKKKKINKLKNPNKYYKKHLIHPLLPYNMVDNESYKLEFVEKMRKQRNLILEKCKKQINTSKTSITNKITAKRRLNTIEDEPRLKKAKYN